MNIGEIVKKFALRTGRRCRGQPSAVGGGSISRAFKIATDNGRVFLKVDRAERLSMFEAEAEGLGALSEARVLKVPDVLDCGLASEYSYLAMDWLEFGSKCNGAEQRLGRGLARQHRVLGKYFGWHRDNTIGATHQPNNLGDDWLVFLCDQRIGFQLDLASSNGLPRNDVERAKKLLDSFDFYFGDYRPDPSLLHGDLWAGNWGVTLSGNPVLYDPAVYFGDREADLAMTRLFGSFGKGFYESYQEDWPLAPGWELRVDLYNLYHLLNHFNLFGGSYLPQLQTTMARLVSWL